MKALIYKDFISTKKSMGLMAIILVAMGYYFHRENQLALLPFTFALIPTIFLGILFGIDDISHNDKYIISTGIKKEKIVLSRYTFIWIISAIGLVVSFIVGMIIKNSFAPMVLLLSLVALFTSLISIIQLPLMYKFGADKARIMFVIMYFIVFASFSLIGSNKKVIMDFINFGIGLNKNLLGLGIFALTIVLNIVSAKLAIWIYKNKEF